MNTQHEFKIGVLGFGTVGSGTVQCLLQNQDVMTRRTGIKLVLHKIADLDIVTDRGFELPADVLTTNSDEVLESCDIIVELIGGVKVAKELILKALKIGKTVVTANKSLLAQCGEELFEVAEKSGANLYYEASVGGGIPIIKVVREALVGNRFSFICGILNGTCNYILTEMGSRGISFEEALQAAQEYGYAESDPTLDVSGLDTAHKTAILASLAYGEWIGLDPIYVEGISNIKYCDLQYADQLGYCVKLMSFIRQQQGNVEVRVHPALIPKTKLIADVSGVFNAVSVYGDFVGETLYYGRGAGSKATASAVVSDIMDAALNLSCGSYRRVPPFRIGKQFEHLVPISEVHTRHYLRLCCRDAVGVYSKITETLARNNISISSISQKESVQRGCCITALIMTHVAKEAEVLKAIQELEQMPECCAPIIRIRVED